MPDVESLSMCRARGQVILQYTREQGQNVTPLSRRNARPPDGEAPSEALSAHAAPPASPAGAGPGGVRAKWRLFKMAPLSKYREIIHSEERTTWRCGTRARTHARPTAPRESWFIRRRYGSRHSRNQISFGLAFLYTRWRGHQCHFMLISDVLNLKGKECKFSLNAI